MAIKGTTRIELTDTKTGEVEVIEKHNLVTNALASVRSNIFNWQNYTTSLLSENNYNAFLDFDGDTSYAPGGSFGTFLDNPLPTLIGGILLHKDKIPESESQLYAQTGNELIGYASYNVNTTLDKMRGSINRNESGFLESNDGMRFVFDFNTSQANGIFQSLSLTSYWGGLSGYGNINSNYFGASIFPVFNDDVKLEYMKIDPMILTTIVSFDDSNGVAISAYVTTAGCINIAKVLLPIKTWHLASDNSLSLGGKIIEETGIQTNTFAKKTYSQTTHYYSFCDGKDGYIWGFEHSNGKVKCSSEKSSVNWIKIDKTTLEFEEGTWNIDAKINAFGQYSYYFNKENADKSKWYNLSFCKILDGFLYCYNYNNTTIIKINLSNITDTSEIQIPYNLKESELYRMFEWGGRIHLHFGYINGNTIIKSTDAYISLYNTTSDGSGVRHHQISVINSPFKGSSELHTEVCNLLHAGVFSFGFNYERQRFRTFFYIKSPYLATINNLTEPVVKTADKTMKITYIIREEADT